MSSEDVIKHFSSSENTGLSQQEATARLAKFGKNKLAAQKKITLFQHFLNQFKELMVIILLIVGAIAFSLGEVFDAVVILFIVILNAIIGVVQEFKAEKAIDALKKMMNPHATVVRDSQKRIIAAEDLVPGDIVILEEGTRVPADCRILEGIMLKVDESVLTGESVPQTKSEAAMDEKETAVSDRTNMLFTGTSIIKGRCCAIVTATGMQTEFGKIAGLTSEIKDEKSPLQKQIVKVSKLIAKAVLIICAVVFVIGLIGGKSWFDMFLFAVSLGVAAVPEGLPATMTIALALGVQKLAKKRAIVRKLASVETLGSTTVICTDKTGTLTKNEMTVKRIYVNKKMVHVEGEGYNPEGRFLLNSQVYSDSTLIKMLRAGLLCNNANLQKENEDKRDQWIIVGDPTEGALVVSAEKAGLRHKHEAENYKRVFEIPFSSETKRMVTIHQTAYKKQGVKKGSSEIIAFMKGAPGIVLDACTHIEINGKIKKLTKKQREDMKVISREMSNKALRVLAFGFKMLKGKNETSIAGFKKLKVNKFVFLGLQGMIDPPRPEVKEAVTKCRKAGIRIFVITGDHGLTAKAVAKEIGLATEATRIIKGIELDKMNEEELGLTLREEVIFARMSAEHKMRIVSNLMKQGEIVAVTGDGVNDAPALKRANIGVAMGITGTDVSKEAAKMVLADDNFASIVNSVEEGRNIFENIRIFLKYLFIGNSAGILAVFVSLLVGLPLPFVALQILWFNLLTETLPSIALTTEPPEKGLMEKKPRNPKEIFLTKEDGFEMGMNALIITVGVLGVFYYMLKTHGWSFTSALGLGSNPAYIYATTMAFTTLVLFQLFNVFNTKSPNVSIFFEELFNNKWLLAATALSIILQVVVVHLGFLNQTFKTTPLSIVDWLIAALVASSIIWINEIYKMIRIRKRMKTAAKPA